MFYQGNCGMEEDLSNPEGFSSNSQTLEGVLEFPDCLLGCGVLKDDENQQLTTAKRGCPSPCSHPDLFSTLLSSLMLIFSSLTASLIH